MVQCSQGDHDDCKHVLTDTLAAIPLGTIVQWADDHVTYPVEGDWTPSPRALAKWVDVRFLNDGVPGWNWHLTLENHVDRDFYRVEEGDEVAEPNWASVDVSYNCWIDVVYYDNRMDEIVTFVRPLDSDRATYADRIADLVDEALAAAGIEMEADKVKLVTIGGWTEGHLNNALSAWIQQETGNSYVVEYDDDAEPGPMAQKVIEAQEACANGAPTYEIGVLDNDMKVMVTSDMFEKLADMDPKVVRAMMEALNDGPGQANPE